MLKFSINDDFKVIDKQLKSYLIKANALISKQFNSNSYYDLCVVDNKGIKYFNHKYAKKNKPTDVLSFRLLDAKNDIKTNLLGEIFVNYQLTKIQAKQHKVSFYYEFTLLFIHGILHLLGFDHDNSKSKEKMFSLQEKILASVIKPN